MYLRNKIAGQPLAEASPTPRNLSLTSIEPPCVLPRRCIISAQRSMDTFSANEAHNYFEKLPKELRATIFSDILSACFSISADDGIRILRSIISVSSTFSGDVHDLLMHPYREQVDGAARARCKAAWKHLHLPHLRLKREFPCSTCEGLSTAARHTDRLAQVVNEMATRGDKRRKGHDYCWYCNLARRLGTQEHNV